MPFLEHLEELRWRLIKSILAVVATTGIALMFSDHIFKFFIHPLGDVKLHFTEVTGSFMGYLKIAIYAGIVAAIPIIFYQLWKFVAPGLYHKEKKDCFSAGGGFGGSISNWSILLFLCSAALCHQVPGRICRRGDDAYHHYFKLYLLRRIYASGIWIFFRVAGNRLFPRPHWCYQFPDIKQGTPLRHSIDSGLCGNCHTHPGHFQPTSSGGASLLAL